MINLSFISGLVNTAPVWILFEQENLPYNIIIKIIS